MIAVPSKNKPIRDEAVSAEQASLLFVCWGNVCRSPAGESIMRKYLQQQNAEAFMKVDSAGVYLDDSPPRPSLSMRWASFRRGYRLGFDPRIVCRTDLKKFDLVVAMDHSNLYALRSIDQNPVADVKLLSDFLPAGMPSDVPDPMNRSLNVCNTVLDMIEAACPSIAHYLFNQCALKRQAGSVSMA